MEFSCDNLHSGSKDKMSKMPNLQLFYVVAFVKKGGVMKNKEDMPNRFKPERPPTVFLRRVLPWLCN